MSTKIAHNLSEKLRTKDVLISESVSFKSLLLSDNTLKGLTQHGYEKPSPIQLKGIPLGRCGFDLIAKSKSGTGKTLVFSIIALEMLNLEKQQPQVLILVPTREIAVQIVNVLTKIGSFYDQFKVEAFIGGLPIDEDIKKLKGCHIVVGAPGRIKHLINAEHLNTQFINLLVFDEADKLMEKSFKDDINEIYNSLPLKKQVIASSATYPDSLDEFLRNYMLSPTFVNAENETPILLGLKQFVYILQTPNAAQEMKIKNEGLINILTKVSFTQCLVFSKYQSRTESVCNILKQKGWNATFISAALSQNKRLEAVNSLKEFKCRILLTTDLTSRGIDAANVDLVINYDLPDDAMTYLHRMGRAGRYGSKGVCISFVLENELNKLQTIIGQIGGENLSVSVLSNLDDNIDLWALENLEQLHGILSDKQLDKNDVIQLKGEQRICKKQKPKIKNLENSKNPLISNGENPKNEIDKVNTTEQQSSQLTQENKKRKINPLETKSEEKNFIKNKAILTTTVLLNESQKDVDEDSVNAITEFLQLIKDEESDTKEECNVKLKENNEKQTNNEIMENIFDVAFKSCVNPEEKHWLQQLPDNEIKNFEEYRNKNESEDNDDEGNEDYAESDDDYYEKDNFFTNEEEDEDVDDEYPEASTDNYDMDNEDNKQQNLKWVPVEEKPKTINKREKIEKTKEIEFKVNENVHFEHYFNECSNSLWQNGLSFDNVEAFDEWFSQWQRQVEAVREYVRQNIYLEDMLKYKESKSGGS